MFRSMVEAVSKRFARVKEPASAVYPSLSRCPQVNENQTPVIALIQESGQDGVASDLVVTKPDEVWTPANVVIPERDLSEAEENEIRTTAYLRWEAAGKPNGHQGRFWLEAREELLQGSQGGRQE